MRTYFHGDPIEFVQHTDLYENRYNFNYSLKVNLSASVDSDTDDILTINARSNKVKLEIHSRYKETYSDFDISYIGKSPLKYSGGSSYGNYAGTVYEALESGCSSCHNFSYVVQLVIDMENYMIKHLFLNSESINWTDADSQMHNIKNIYTMRKTECALYKGTDKCQHISIPMIPLNLSNPHETMQRIKILNTFS